MFHSQEYLPSDAQREISDPLDDLPLIYYTHLRSPSHPLDHKTPPLVLFLSNWIHNCSEWRHSLVPSIDEMRWAVVDWTDGPSDAMIELI